MCNTNLRHNNERGIITSEEQLNYVWTVWVKKIRTLSKRSLSYN